MTDLMELIKPQLDALRQMYRNGYEAGLAEGKRRAWLEVKKILEQETEA